MVWAPAALASAIPARTAVAPSANLPRKIKSTMSLALQDRTTGPSLSNRYARARTPNSLGRATAEWAKGSRVTAPNPGRTFVDQTDTPPIDQPRPERERVFNAPWTIVAL